MTEKQEWSIAVSWGCVVEVYKGFISPLTLQRPARTFLSWYMKMTKEHCFMNTRKFVKDFLQQFLLLLFAKMRHNVPPNHKVLECCQLLDTCFTMVDCYEARNSWVSTNFCIFPSLIISLNFNIWNKQFQKNSRFQKII
jgi:hypothetical protein